MLLALLMGAAVLAAVPAAGAATPAPRRALGARRPTTHVAPAFRAYAALPASVDLSAWRVPIGDQGYVGSCVTWAIDYGMLGWYARRDAKGGTPFAPMYTYSQINGGHDDGSWPVDALNVAVSQGTDTRAHYSQGDYNWWSQPNAAERRNAANYKISGYHILFSGMGGQGVDGAGFGDAGAQAIKAALASGKPVAIGFAVRDGFYDLDSAHTTDNDTHTRLAGYHEVLALGYDTRGVLIQNSWGIGWGARGLGRLSWAVVKADVDEAYTIDGFASLPPTAAVQRLSRTSGPTAGGTTVVVTGTALRGVTQVRFGSTAVNQFSVDAGGTHLTVRTPAHAAGLVDVTLWKGARRSATGAPSRFTFVAPRPPAHVAVRAGFAR